MEERHYSHFVPECESFLWFLDTVLARNDLPLSLGKKGFQTELGL